MTRRDWIAGVAGAALTGAMLRPGFTAEATEIPSLRVLFFSDVHAGFNDEIGKPLELAAKAMRSIDADLILCGGDVIHQGYVLPVEACVPRFAQYRNAFLANLDRPVEHVIGNHDLAGAYPNDGSAPAKDPRALVMKELGIEQTYRSLDIAGYRFLILDVVELTGDAQKYRGIVDAKQLKWIETSIADWPRQKPIVLVTHIPFRSTFLQAKESPTTPLNPRVVVDNANQVLDLFEGRNLPLVLQGHLHSNEVINWAGRHFVMGGALCAGWWKGPNLQTSYGFGCLEIASGKMSWDYLPYGWA